MRNWNHRPGVYCNMRRLAPFLICPLLAVAQPSAPRQSPLDAALQAVWQARNGGNFEAAAAARERARGLLQQAPVETPQFAGWAQQVSQLYADSGLNAQARAVLQEAMGRSSALPVSNPSRIAILSALADAWQRDGNLLKAVGFLEQAASAQAAAPPAVAAQPGAPAGIAFAGPLQGVVFSSLGGRFGNYFGGGENVYIRLADMYRQLGWPDAAAAVVAKRRLSSPNDESALASYFERNGQTDEAAAIYKKLAEGAAEPQTQAPYWQMLANVYERQQRYPDAVAAMQRAIAAVQSSDQPGVRNQALSMRLQLAGMLHSAGMIDQADQAYRQILQENRGGPQESGTLTSYAQYLVETQRGAQGAGILTDYLESGSAVDPQSKMNALYGLANITQGMGDSKRADEYRQAAQALQPQQPPPLARNPAWEELQKAQNAVNVPSADDGYTLAMHAIGMAKPSDVLLIEQFVPGIANSLVAKKEPAKAEKLFQRILAMAQDATLNSMQPLIEARQNYVRFLMNQPDRLSDVPFAIDEFRRVLSDANGPESGSLAEPLRLKIDFARSHSQSAGAKASSNELLEMQESLSGKTSEAYLRDLQLTAGVYEAAGDFAGALPLRKSAIPLADMFGTPNKDSRPVQARVDTALALAHLGQFDEAETLGAEAVALEHATNSGGPNVAWQLQQIQGMKKAAANQATTGSVK